MTVNSVVVHFVTSYLLLWRILHPKLLSFSRLLIKYVNRALYYGEEPSFFAWIRFPQDPEQKSLLFWRIIYKVGIGKFTSHRELFIKEVLKVTIANDILRHRWEQRSDRPLIEQIIGETGDNRSKVAICLS